MARHMISANDLIAILHRPDAPAILDLRTPEDAAADPTKLPAARRLSLADLAAGAGPHGPAVIYCQKGGKISQLGAALLRRRGIVTRALAGGHLGWIVRDLPVQPLDTPEGATWVMAEDPGWAGLCDLWALHRLTDPTARILAVADDQVAAAAKAMEARPLGATFATWPWIAPPAATPALEALLRGRLARTGDPLAALDLVDDALAGAAL
ncbi:MAG: hypothetical protein AAF390_03215 [Pseudomonadota bacterium]